MNSAPAYSDRVRQLFAAPRHAGDADDVAVEVARGTECVVLGANLDGQRLAKLAFRVYGCPHLIAAAETFCEDFEGREAADMAAFSGADMRQKLAIPVEKAGRILLLEDAIRALAAKIAANPP